MVVAVVRVRAVGDRLTRQAYDADVWRREALRVVLLRASNDWICWVGLGSYTHPFHM